MVFSLVSAARRAGLAVFLACLSLGLAAPAIAAPTISVDDVTVSEGNGLAKNAVFTVSLSAPSAVDVGFWVGTAELSAVGNDDFQHYYSSPYTIPAGQTTYTLNLVIFGDTVMEADETFQVLLENVTNATVAKGVGIGTIVNDDAGASPTLLVADQWIVEGNTGSKQALFNVQLSQPAATDVSFSVATANGTASAGSDYTAVNLSNQVIPAGQLSKTIAVTIAGDASSERDETFSLNLSNAAGAVIGRGAALGTIANDDNVSAVKISVDDVYVQERDSGTQTATFYVRLSKASASAVTFDLKTQDSSATAGSDYAAINLTSQTIAAGQTSKMYSVTAYGDTTAEPEERFVLTLSNISNAAVQYSDPHGVGTIPNDDPFLSIGDATVTEGDQGTVNLAFTVLLSLATNHDVQFHVVTCDGSATVADADYQASSTAAFTTIPAGSTGVVFNVAVNGDTAVEPDETLCVDLADVSGADLADGHGVGTILNDDDYPPTVDISGGSVLEGDSPFNYAILNFPLTLSHTFKNTVYVKVHTEACGGTAQPGVNTGDYEAVNDTYSLNPGTLTRSVTVYVRGDTDFEPDEQLCVKIDSATNAVVGNATALGTILNDDSPPMISVSDASVFEAYPGLSRTLSFYVSLSKPSQQAVTFDVFTDYGTATPEVDFTPKAMTGVTFAPGQTGMFFDVTVPGDNEVEADETLTVNLANVVGVPVAKGQGFGRIFNDDNATLSISDATVVEGDDGTTTARFVVTLSKPMPTPVTFDVATYPGGTATPGSDYVARSQASRLMDPGRTRVDFEVPILGDTTDESDEFFYVGIANARGAFINDQLRSGTIQDDDAPAATSIAQVQGEGATSTLVGRDVTVEGIVTAILAPGFALQSPDDRQDGNAATSEGLFVSRAGTGPRVGDRVRVHGRVTEAAVDGSQGGRTQTWLESREVSVLAHDQPLPAPVLLRDEPAAATARGGVALERLEGMRVEVSPLTVRAPSGGVIDERSGAVRGDGRFHGAVRLAGLPAQSLRIDSTGQAGAVAWSADRGDVVTGLRGVLAQGREAYDLLPDASAQVAIASRARPAPVATPATTEATIGSFNLRRFLDDARQADEPVPSPTAYSTRLAKTANAICAYARSPAILAVQDVENGAALADLAAAVNSRAGNVLFPRACTGDPAYVAVRDDAHPRSRLGLLLSTAPVRPGVARVEARRVASLLQDETFAWRDGGREPLFESPPLLVQARINGEGGETLDVALLVVQSGDFDARGRVAAHGWVTRADYLRARRAAQGRALAGVLRSQQRLHPQQPLLVLGDVDPLPATLGLADLTALSPPSARYSVIRDGQPEVADRVLASQALLAPAVGARVEFARIDADFGEDNLGDGGVPMRVSDHDPLVVFLRMR